jgi:hypothetical protein
MGEPPLLCGQAVLDMIRDAVSEEYPGCEIRTLQVGYHQGDEWYRIDGEDSDELREFVQSLDYTDESLYEETSQERMLRLAAHWDNGPANDRRTIIDAIREHYNCQTAKIDGDGDVWISDPMEGHWLSYYELGELVDAIED